MTTSQTPTGKRPRSKADRAYKYIKEQIDAGKFEPHDRVLAGPLATILGMSGVPIREAIQRLAAEGILSIEHNVGARVAVFDGQAYRDGMEALAVMDGVATALAAKHISSADLERAEAYNNQIIALLDDFDPARYSVLNAEFHAILYSKCPNARILELVRHEWQKFANLRDPALNVDVVRARTTVVEHQQILEVIRTAASSTAIEQTARRHVLASLQASTGVRSDLLHPETG